MTIKPIAKFMLLGLLCSFCIAANGYAFTIDFDDLVHGEIVNNQYESAYGVTISASNPNRDFNLAAAFDTTLTGTRDADLEGNPWSGGNLAPSADLGRILIIAENNNGAGDGILNYPDDEGSRPAGEITMLFDAPMYSFGLDLIDVEGPAEYNESSGYFATFYSDAGESATVGFGEFVSLGDLYDPTVEFGNNMANRIAPITADMLGLAAFDKVIINFGGSAGIDNITATRVPEPAAMLLLGTGLIGIAGLSRRMLK